MTSNTNDNPEQAKLWYVIHTQSQREDSVAQRLKDHIAREHLEESFGQIVVPTEEVLEMRAGQKIKSQRKIFPGYVWVQMIMNPTTWHFVKQVSGVIRFVGGKEPAPIPEKEVQAVLNQSAGGAASKPRPKTLYEPGEVVRITEGPFADFDAVVEDVNYEKNRLRVSVSIFGRSTPVELEFSQVTKI